MKRRLPILIVVLIALAATLCAAPEKVDWLITAAHVVTMDRDLHILEPGTIAVRGDQIVAVGLAADLSGRYTAPAAQTLQLGDRWVMPGLINTHTHIPMNLMRGLADDLELMTWLQKYIFPLEARVVNARYVYEASLVASGELIRRGTTAIVDMYYFEDDEARAVKEAGLRGWLGETILDFPAPDFKTPRESLAATETWIRKWAADPMVHVIPAPHSLYTCSPEFLKEARALSDKAGCLLTYHLAESENEVNTITRKFGKTPVAAAAEMGLLGPRVLIGHGVHLTAEDQNLLQIAGCAVAHNPDSNLKLASGLAPVVELRKRGIRVGLGTDGSVSSNRLDLFHAMDLASKAAKIREHDATALPALEAVKMATIDAARAIGAEKEIGSLEPGKKADLIVLDLSGPEYAPVYNIYSHLVYVAHGEAVVSTMAGGRWLMRDRRLLTLDPARLAGIADTYRTQILKILDELKEKK